MGSFNSLDCNSFQEFGSASFLENFDSFPARHNPDKSSGSRFNKIREPETAARCIDCKWQTANRNLLVRMGSGKTDN